MPEKKKGLLGAGYFDIITTVYMLIMVLVFPLVYHEYYYDILTTKYQFYWMLSIVLLMLSLFGGIFCCVRENIKIKELISIERIKGMRKSYLFLTGFLIFCVISTITSEYLYESFWGNEGRFTGLFLLLIYGFVTFVLASKAKDKQWILDVFIFTGLLICLFGITDYFRMDILGWKANANAEQADVFYSTLGNVNTYTAYVGMINAICCGLLAFEKNKIRLVYYYIVLIISFVGIITGQSDNAYLSIGALFAIIPFFTFGNLEGVTRYGFMGSAFLIAVKYVDYVGKAYKGKVIGIYGLFNKIAGFKYLEAVVAIVVLITLALLAICIASKKKEKEIVFGKKLIYAWGVFVALAFLAVAAVLIDANLLGNGDRYGALKTYLVFTDEWGTMRGFAWKTALKCYNELPFIHKLFGHGADTFGILTWAYRRIAIDNYGFYFESAHNEFLQFFVTVGPFATICYIGFLISSCVEMGRKVKENKLLLAPLLAVACYAAQSIVNINLPIATPIMWLFIAIGLAGSREEKKEEE